MGSAAKTCQPETRPIATVAVAAASRVVRARIASNLKAESRFTVRTMAAPHRLGAAEAPSVLVCHCEAIGGDEIALVKSLRQKFPELRIVLVSDTANAGGTRRAVDSGVQGIVSADHLESALLCTVAAVLAGQTAIPSELRANGHKTFLSFREKQILAMVVMGCTNAEIGAQLYLAESTVKSHLSSAFAKLGVRSRSEAAAIIVDPHGSLGTGILAITPNAESRAA